VSVSQPWAAGSDADKLVTMYTADATGTLLALVELGKVPLDGTWEVMHATSTGAIEWNRATVGQYHGGAWMDSMLVVARPIGSGNE
jgi:hypothetical protein